jgi:hypothetical protein
MVHPSLFIRPAWGEFARRSPLPGLVVQAALPVHLQGRSLLTALERLGRALPTGCSATRRWRRRCAACSTRPAAATTSAAAHKLVLVATDLDSGDVGALRPAGLGPCADLAGRGRQRGAAGAVPAGAHRRPLVRGRRAEEDAARRACCSTWAWTCCCA